MKKFKNNILLFLLTICAVAIVGIDKVNADVYLIGNTSTIICEPDTLSAGKATDCYLVGKPEPATGDVSVHGYVTYAYTTKYLELIGATANSNVTNSDVKFMPPSSATGGLTASGNMPTSLNGFKCVYDTDNVASGLDFGCAIFYTVKTSATNAFTPTSITRNNSTEILPKGDTTYGVIGSYQVKAANNAEGDECGELCVKAWVIPGVDDYLHYESCQADGKKEDGGDCSGITQIQTKGEGNYECQEVHYVGKTNPDTGAFASYTLLIAGALIAISAIVLAKKNNKLYRV